MVEDVLCVLKDLEPKIVMMKIIINKVNDPRKDHSYFQVRDNFSPHLSAH